jgi:hypothetical protein
MSISKYNLIKFVEISFKDHKRAQDTDWNEWFQTVSRLYNHRVPETVVCTILRISDGNEELLHLCSTELERIQQEKARIAQKEASKVAKYQAWLLKRDAGNTHAQLQRIEWSNAEMLRIHEKERETNEAYVRDMLPMWQDRLDEYIQKREFSISTLFK